MARHSRTDTASTATHSWSQDATYAPSMISSARDTSSSSFSSSCAHGSKGGSSSLSGYTATRHPAAVPAVTPARAANSSASLKVHVPGRYWREALRDAAPFVVPRLKTGAVGVGQQRRSYNFGWQQQQRQPLVGGIGRPPKHQPRLDFGFGWPQLEHAYFQENYWGQPQQLQTHDGSFGNFGGHQLSYGYTPLLEMNTTSCPRANSEGYFGPQLQMFESSFEHYGRLHSSHAYGTTATNYHHDGEYHQTKAEANANDGAPRSVPMPTQQPPVPGTASTRFGWSEPPMLSFVVPRSAPLPPLHQLQQQAKATRFGIDITMGYSRQDTPVSSTCGSYPAFQESIGGNIAERSATGTASRFSEAECHPVTVMTSGASKPRRRGRRSFARAISKILICRD